MSFTTKLARHAWKAVFVLFLLLLALGVGEYFQGQGGDPGMVEAVSGLPWPELNAQHPGIARLLDVETRIIGALWAGFGLTGAAAALHGLRHGARWSWWAALSLPLVMAAIIGAFLAEGLVTTDPMPPALISAPVTIVLSAVALALGPGQIRNAA